MARKGFKFHGILSQAEQQQAEKDVREKGTEAQVKKSLKVLDEFKHLIPPLTPDEFHKLEISIMAEGCRDPLIVWDKGEEWILIDGHNRYQICQSHTIDYSVILMQFEDTESVSNWIVNNQLGKRNATSETKSYLRGLQYSREKKKESTWQNLRQYKGTEERENQVLTGNTAGRLGELHKVNEKTIKRDEKYAIAIDKICNNNRTLKAEILQKNILLPKGKITKLADEPSEKLEALGDCLMQGMIFLKAYKTIFPEHHEPEEEEPDDEQLRKEKSIRIMKMNILITLDAVIKTKNKTHIENLHKYLEQLEQNL